MVHQARLTDDQRLTGELLVLDADGLRLRTPWAERLAVPRSCLEGVTQLPGRLLIRDEGFEDGLKVWKVSGSPAFSDKHHTSGQHSLVLAAPGQSAAYALPLPLPAGRLGVNFLGPETAAGARWQVEAEFQGPGEPRRVRVTIAGEGDSYDVSAPTPRDEGVRVPRKPGWHRLVVEFGERALLVTVDDALLWFSRRGPGGPLRQVRLFCAAAGGKAEPRGAVAFDDLTLERSVAVLPGPAEEEGQDDVWLASGDQLFGQVLRADRRGIDLQAAFGRRSFSWAEVRGVFPQRTPRAPQTTEGEHVRVWLRPAEGTEPDELEAVLVGLDDRRLTLRHPGLGDLEVPRARLQRLRPLFHGRRIELDNGSHRLGSRESPVPDARPRAEGPGVRYTFRLDAPPGEARLVLRLLQREGADTRTDVVLNGRRVEDLGRRAGGVVRRPLWLVVPLPRGGLREGDNVLEVRQADGRGLCAISDLAVEVPQ
jgi:hypothetical protein